MKIRGWHIDGFGLFRDTPLGDLDPKLNVLVGPNEAGKSTLLEFVRGMLFGFPLRRGRPDRYPARPGLRHGGRLWVDTEDGAAVIERFAEKGAGVRVAFADGRTGGAAELEQWLRRADDRLFRDVFAIGLSELQNFELLKQGEVKDRIFSAGVVGAGRSARAVLTALEESAAQLLKPRAGGVVNKLLDEIGALEKQLDAARHAAGDYPALMAREENAGARMAELSARCDQLRAERKHFENLEALWPTWVKQAGALRRLMDAALASLDSEAMADVMEAAASSELYRKYLDDYLTLSAEREARQAEAAGRMRDLGAEWSEERIKTCDLSLARREEIRGFLATIAEARDTRQRAAVALEHKREEHTQASRVAARTAEKRDAVEKPDVEKLDAREKALRRARASLQELSRFEDKLDSVEERINVRAAAESRQLPAWVANGAIALGVIIAAVGCYLNIKGQMAFGLSLLLVAMVLAALGMIVMHTRRAVPTANDDLNAERDELNEKCERERESLLAVAKELSLPEDFNAHQIEERDAEYTAARERQQEWERLDDASIAASEALAVVAADLAALEQRLAACEGELARVEAAWAARRAQLGIPEALSPEGVLQLLAGVDGARSALAVYEERRDAAAVAATQILAWEERVLRLLGESPDSPAAPRREELIARLAALRARYETRSELERDVAMYETAIRARLGADADLDAFLEELQAGKTQEWKSAIDEIDSELVKQIAERDAAVREQNEARQRRAALEQSADVAKLELEMESLRERLREAVTEWRVVTMAHGLGRQTLNRVQRERQPAVTAEAAQFFAKVTNGRYVRLLPQDEPETLLAEMPNGETRTPEQLSRGTCEQLYLCLRLAFAREFRNHGCNLPLVMDDVLVNFDPERARAVAQLLAEFAEQNQVLLFTCHPSTAELFAGLGKRIDLPRLA